jgi:hypothetical protein
MYFYDIEWIDNYFDKHCLFIHLRKERDKILHLYYSNVVLLENTNIITSYEFDSRS